MRKMGGKQTKNKTKTDATTGAHLVQLLYSSDQQRVAGRVLEIDVVCGRGAQRREGKKEREERQLAW